MPKEAAETLAAVIYAGLHLKEKIDLEDLMNYAATQLEYDAPMMRNLQERISGDLPVIQNSVAIAGAYLLHLLDSTEREEYDRLVAKQVKRYENQRVRLMEAFALAENFAYNALSRRITEELRKKCKEIADDRTQNGRPVGYRIVKDKGLLKPSLLERAATRITGRQLHERHAKPTTWKVTFYRKK